MRSRYESIHPQNVHIIDKLLQQNASLMCMVKTSFSLRQKGSEPRNQVSGFAKLRTKVQPQQPASLSSILSHKSQ